MKDRNKIMRFFGLHPQNDVRRKFAFTLAEGATHVDNSNNKRRFAFTLAEVLVTLGIIGVVAVLTVPNVISSYQKKVYVVQLQKAYNQLQQVFSLAMAEDEVEYLADTELMQSMNGLGIDAFEGVPEDGFVAQLGKYLRITKVCQVGEFDNDCHNIEYSRLDPDGPKDNQDGSLQIFTKDGMIYYFRFYFSKVPYLVCQSDAGLSCDEVKSSGGNVCYAHSESPGSDLYIDVNGRKGPNKFGRDLFSFIVDEKGNLYPWGSISVYGENNYWDNSQGGTDCTLDSGGGGCAGRIFDNGWVMDY